MGVNAKVFKVHYSLMVISLTIFLILASGYAFLPVSFLVDIGSSIYDHTLWKDHSRELIHYAIFFGVILLSLLFIPRDYIVDEKSLLIRKTFMPIIINGNEIESVSRPSKADMKWSIRAFGIGGYFGFSGYYWNKALGDFRMWVGEAKNYILIEISKGKKFVIAGNDELYNAIMDLKNRCKE
jgi:hypothetical protein